MLEAVADAGHVVDVDRRHLQQARALPQGDDRDQRRPQVREESRLVLHVAEQDDRVAVAGLEDGRQRERLVGPALGVAEDHVVAAGHRLDRQGLDGAREERVGDVAHDRAEQHRRGAAQAAGERVGPVAELARRERDALPGLLGDRHPGRGVVQDPRDGALGDPGRGRDVAHRRDRLALGDGARRGSMEGSGGPAVGRGRLAARLFVRAPDPPRPLVSLPAPTSRSVPLAHAVIRLHWGPMAAGAAGLVARGSPRTDVLVETEDVGRIEQRLRPDEPVVIGAVRRSDAVLTFVHVHVHVGAAR